MATFPQDKLFQDDDDDDDNNSNNNTRIAYISNALIFCDTCVKLKELCT